jgi:hypothetical protein
MSLNKPEPGEKFGHAVHDGPLIFIGFTTDGRWVVELPDGNIGNITPKVAATEVFPYVEPVKPLERGQFYARTRYDYQGQTAEILGVVKDRDSASEPQTFVVYVVHQGGNYGPHMKTEVAFRRIFGKEV